MLCKSSSPPDHSPVGLSMSVCSDCIIPGAHIRHTSKVHSAHLLGLLKPIQLAIKIIYHSNIDWVLIVIFKARRLKVSVLI